MIDTEKSTSNVTVTTMLIPIICTNVHRIAVSSMRYHTSRPCRLCHTLTLSRNEAPRSILIIIYNNITIVLGVLRVRIARIADTARIKSKQQ